MLKHLRNLKTHAAKKRARLHHRECEPRAGWAGSESEKAQTDSIPQMLKRAAI